MIDSQSTLQQERETKRALFGGLALVLFPGLGLVIGLIALVIPPLPPIPTLNGCYRLAGFPTVRVSPTTISVSQDGIQAIKISIDVGKEGYVIDAETGFSFKTDNNGRVQAYKDYRLGELITVYITRNRPPALGLIADGHAVKLPKVDCHAD